MFRIMREGMSQHPGANRTKVQSHLGIFDGVLIARNTFRNIRRSDFPLKRNWELTLHLRGSSTITDNAAAGIYLCA